MKVLVTGGAGYIGSHTIVELFRMGYTEVFSVDNYSNSLPSFYENIENTIDQKLTHYQVDLANQAECDAFFDSNHFDAIIHFAALKSVPESVEKPTLFFHNNINALNNVLDNMLKHSIKNIIFSSSCSVYGNPKDLPVTESTPFGIAESPYALTKQIGENMIEQSCRHKKNINGLSLRYFNPAGADESGKIGEAPSDRPNNLVPIICQQAAGEREKITVFGSDYKTRDGSCIRDYVHVSDIAKAHVLALDYVTKMNGNYDVLNLGSGNGSTTLEVLKAFEKENDLKLNYEIGPRRAGDVESIYANNSKASEMLNWKPEKSLGSIVKTAWNWQRALTSDDISPLLK